MITFGGGWGEWFAATLFVARTNIEVRCDDAVGICRRMSLLRNFLFSKLLIVLWEMRN